MAIEKLLTRQEAAEQLRLKAQTLAAWGADGKHLPFIRCGRSVRYKESDVEKFIQQRTTPVTDQHD
jgi:excisionase family DNA binding protein